MEGKIHNTLKMADYQLDGMYACTCDTFNDDSDAFQDSFFGLLKHAYDTTICMNTEKP